MEKPFIKIDDPLDLVNDCFRKGIIFSNDTSHQFFLIIISNIPISIWNYILNELPKPPTPKKRNIYEVEKILDGCLKRNKVYYLVKWASWEGEYSTWEPLSNLSNCLELVEEFEKNYQKERVDRVKRNDDKQVEIFDEKLRKRKNIFYGNSLNKKKNFKTTETSCSFSLTPPSSNQSFSETPPSFHQFLPSKTSESPSDLYPTPTGSLYNVSTHPSSSSSSTFSFFSSNFFYSNSSISSSSLSSTCSSFTTIFSSFSSSSFSSSCTSSSFSSSSSSSSSCTYSSFSSSTFSSSFSSSSSSSYSSSSYSSSSSSSSCIFSSSSFSFPSLPRFSPREKKNYSVLFSNLKSLDKYKTICNQNFLLNFINIITQLGLVVKKQGSVTIATNEELKHEDKKKALKKWEDKINSIMKQSNNAPIKVENNVDLEGPPSNFTFVTKSFVALGNRVDLLKFFQMQKEGLIKSKLNSCSCKNCSRKSHNCCVRKKGHKMAYDNEMKLNISWGEPIYECNIFCNCGNHCHNRVVQKGRQIPVAIFRTENGKGWGVKALVDIEKGSFVEEYVGEIITSEEAERRGVVYDAEQLTYLFDLDFYTSDNEFTLDAYYYGNVSHFFNHSCNPNLVVFNVWINELNKNLPHLAFFSSRKILKGEELTFDYHKSNQTQKKEIEENSHVTKGSKRSSGSKWKERRLQNESHDSPLKQNGFPDSPKAGKHFCLCGEFNCKKYLFY